MLRKPWFPLMALFCLGISKSYLGRWTSVEGLHPSDCLSVNSLLMIDQKGPAHYCPWHPWKEGPRLYRKVNEDTTENKTVSSIPRCFLLPDSEFDFIHRLPFIINYEWKMKPNNQINAFFNKLCLINVLKEQCKSKQGRNLPLYPSLLIYVGF